MADTLPMRCLFCTTPYRDDDVERVSNPANGEVTKIVYRCRVCEAERETSVSTVANIYGPELAKLAKQTPGKARRVLYEQARRLEG